MPETRSETSRTLDVTSFKLDVLTSKSKLTKALLAHHSFFPRHRELLELSREFEDLKEEGQQLYASKLKASCKI